MTVTEQLADFGLQLRLESLPEKVIESARLRLLDTIGVTLAGVSETCSDIVTQVVLASEPAGPSSLIGSNEKVSPGHAALINGIRGHALEFDDTTSSIVSHTSATVLPSVLALAEELDLSGKEFLEAFIAGFEITTRIGWSTGFNLLKHGWHPNGVLAVMGSAAANARLLGASRQEICIAIGIAASFSSGIRKNVGTMTKPLHMGHAAMDGILAARLARHGYKADPDILVRVESASERKGHSWFSFLETFVGDGNYDVAQIVRNLGSEYELASDSTITRFHPGASYPQAAIDEVIALVGEHDIDPQEIETIRLGVTPRCLEIASYGIPRTRFDARFSLAFAIAAAAIDRSVTIRHYRADSLVGRADMQDMMRRVEAYVPEAFVGVTDHWTGSEPTPISCIVEIRLKDGRQFNGKRHTTRGYPGTRVEWRDVMEKYMSCAAGILPEKQALRAADLIAGIAELDAVRELTSCLQPRLA